MRWFQGYLCMITEQMQKITKTAVTLSQFLEKEIICDHYSTLREFCSF
jgi:hypothetical protein